MGDWLNLPLHERRYISVLEPDPLERSAFGEAVVRQPVRVSFLSRAASAVETVFRKAAEEPDEAETVVLKLLPAQIAGLDFGAQGWEPGVVYAVNPRLPTMYRPLATFHEDLLIHKINELERLLNALGAREYLISQVRRNDVGLAGSLRLRLLEATASSRRQTLEERTWSGTSDGHPPHMPPDLVWYDREAEWQNLVESRFHGSRRKFAFTVKQEDDLGVDARLAAAFKAARLDIGGRYTSTQNFEFSVTGTF